tara:strand:- start:738 stop:1118 length:381 start_codon:yes stop_codon:yes gene_type:complete
MRLYNSSYGQWFGTQRDAQRGAPRDWTEVDVPTSKQDLINWLNANKVGSMADDNLTRDPDGNIVAPYDPDAPVGLYEPELPSSDDVKLVKSAESWVRWSLDKLIMGEKDEAIEMLKLGLKAQKGEK